MGDRHEEKLGFNSSSKRKFIVDSALDDNIGPGQYEVHNTLSYKCSADNYSLSKTERIKTMHIVCNPSPNAYDVMEAFNSKHNSNNRQSGFVPFCNIKDSRMYKIKQTPAYNPGPGTYSPKDCELERRLTYARAPNFGLDRTQQNSSKHTSKVVFRCNKCARCPIAGNVHVNPDYAFPYTLCGRCFVYLSDKHSSKGKKSIINQLRIYSDDDPFLFAMREQFRAV
eukprot:Nk52_evm37s1444 gene=Nk52_evmTU37s1444